MFSAIALTLVKTLVLLITTRLADLNNLFRRTQITLCLS